jgi:hypothetical protein
MSDQLPAPAERGFLPRFRLRHALFAMALLAVALWSSFGYRSICPLCGRIQGTTQLQLPFTHSTYCSWNRDHGVTPVGAAFARAGLVPANHSHDWHFMHGAGNGVSCAIGDGRHLFDPYQSDHVAYFVEATARHEPKALGFWLSILRDPKRANQLRSVAGEFPARAVNDVVAYQDWKAANQWLLDEYSAAASGG